jgi:solute carrier family 25 phosphate transporter 3
MGKNVSFDFIKGFLTSFIKVWFPLLEVQLGAASFKWTVIVFSAFLTSIVACLLSQPGDMILTASCGGHGGHGAPAAAAHGGSSHGHGHETAHHPLHLEPSKKSQKLSFCQACKEIYAKHGLEGFYFGTQARLAHVAFIITTQLVAYDLVNSLLGVASSH